MSALRLRRMLLASVLLLLPTSMNAQFISPAWNTCKGDTLSTWNCAHYYSGTVSLTGEIKGTGIHETNSVVATITAGKVVCHIKGSEAGEWEGPGMIAVQHDNTASAGDYQIMIWCPESEGDRLDRHEGPTIHVQHQRAADYAVLSGKDEYEHPSADSVNGITGTETMTWQLRRLP